MANGRPKVFISSTVHDFRDLRSALKFWLDEQGYDAQASDFNDFEKDLEKDSYSACLDAIAASDYFVLLIGSRVGGLYDKSQGISITRAEYRRAYEQFQKTGRPRILAFVRRDVWNVRADRKALARILEKDEELNRELSDTSRRAITGHSSDIVRQAETTFSFIDEVARLEEAREAMNKSEPLPPGNWVHAFETFGEVVDALRLCFKTGSTRRKALETSLRLELEVIAHRLLYKDKEDSVRRTPASRFAVAARRAALGQKFDDTFTVKLDDLAQAVFFFTAYQASGLGLPTHAMDEALRSGELMEWNTSLHTFVPSLVHLGVERLRDEVSQLQRYAEVNVKPPVYDEWRKAWQEERSDRPVTVSTADLLGVCVLHDRVENILDLAAAVMAALAGKPSALFVMRLWATALDGKKERLQASVGPVHTTALWLSARADKISVEGEKRVERELKEGAAEISRQETVVKKYESATPPPSKPPPPGTGGPKRS